MSGLRTSISPLTPSRSPSPEIAIPTNIWSVPDTSLQIILKRCPVCLITLQLFLVRGPVSADTLSLYLLWEFRLCHRPPTRSSDFADTLRSSAAFISASACLPRLKAVQLVATMPSLPPVSLRFSALILCCLSTGPCLLAPVPGVFMFRFSCCGISCFWVLFFSIC